MNPPGDLRSGRLDIILYALLWRKLDSGSAEVVTDLKADMAS